MQFLALECTACPHLLYSIKTIGRACFGAYATFSCGDLGLATMQLYPHYTVITSADLNA